MLHPAPVESFRAYIEQHQRRFVKELGDWLRIPSISAQHEHREDMARSAELLVASLNALRPDKVEIWRTKGHPAVFATWKQAPGKPTVLVYGHHDVQPVDPLTQWTSPPFEPTVRDGRLYSRGATDDKGQVWIHLKAIETLQHCLGGLPVNLSLIVEGEEEIGSENLIRLFLKHADELAADLVCVSDTDMFQPGVPSVCVMLRGVAYFELRLHSSTTDLHSGSFGGAVVNAANILARVLASLHAPDGSIAIQGFYDDVRPIGDGERDAIRALPFDPGVFQRQAGGAAALGESGFSTLERLWARPSLDINGITAGFQGIGVKHSSPQYSSSLASGRSVSA